LDSAAAVKGIGIVAALAVATLITRFLPFLLFPPEKKIPGYVEYLGRTLPYATMGLLVVYCLKDLGAAAFHGLPEMIAVAAVVVLHWRKGNALVSIGAGTVLYMILVQAVFV